MEWRHFTGEGKGAREFKTFTHLNLIRKVMASVFWEQKGHCWMSFWQEVKQKMHQLNLKQKITPRHQKHVEDVDQGNLSAV